MVQSFSVEVLQGNSARFRLGLAGTVSIALSGFNDQPDAADPSVATSEAHPMPGASLSPRLNAADRDVPTTPSPPRHSESAVARMILPPD